MRLGVLTTYRDEPGPLTDDQLALGVTLAEVTTQVILGVQAGARDGSLHAMLAEEPPIGPKSIRPAA